MKILTHPDLKFSKRKWKSWCDDEIDGMYHESDDDDGECDESGLANMRGMGGTPPHQGLSPTFKKFWDPP